MGIINAVKGVFGKMGEVSFTGARDVFALNGAEALREFYSSNIAVWKSVYSGYHPEWHDMSYRTVEGAKRRRMAGMNAAKALCAELAGLSFNEKCEVVITDMTETENGASVSDTRVSDYIKKALAENGFFGQMQSLIEMSYALGGAAVKVWHEDGGVRLGYVSADRFIPLGWDNRGVCEAVFLTGRMKDGREYTLAEKHTRESGDYRVTNELYAGGAMSAGLKRVPLDTACPGLEEEVVIRGLKRPLFVYFRPNTANNLADVPLGISVFANALDTLKALDVCFDSFTREFVLGRKRIIVPTSALRTVVDQNGELKRFFDSSDEVYQAMAFENAGDMKIQDSSVGLRVLEHTEAINAFLSILSLQTGLTPGTLSFDRAGGIRTATEVISENSKTFKTVKSHENLISGAIAELADVIAEVGKLYDELSPDAEHETHVRFDDSIVEDKNSRAELNMRLVGAGLRSRYTALTRGLGMSPEEAGEEMGRLEGEDKSQRLDG